MGDELDNLITESAQALVKINTIQHYLTYFGGTNEEQFWLRYFLEGF